MKYLKYFTKNSDYQSFMGGGSILLPNVSFVAETKVVAYKPKPKSESQRAIFKTKDGSFLAMGEKFYVKY